MSNWLASNESDSVIVRYSTFLIFCIAAASALILFVIFQPMIESITAETPIIVNIMKFVKKFVPKAKFERKGNVLHIDGGGKSLKRLSQSIYNEFLVDKVMWESVSVVNEGRYHAWRNDESLTPKQKIGMAMRETRDNLTELERVVRYNVRLKNELNVDSRDYWKNTHKA
jgi:hypothetical protein